MTLKPTQSGGGGGGSGTVTQVSSADTSVAVATGTTTPVLTVAALNTIAANHATSGSVAMNSNKLTGLANGTAATDAAAFGQLAGGPDGWTTSSDTWTYASASTFTIAGVDRTAVYTKGTYLKFTQTTAKYAVVVSSSFSTDTTVTIAVNTDYTIANASITSPFYSYQANPANFPSWFAYSASPTGFSAISVNVTRFTVVGHTCTVAFNITGTSNGAGFTFTLPVAAATAMPNWDLPLRVEDNGAISNSTLGLLEITPGSSTTTATLYKDMNGGGWSSSGTKQARAAVSYEI